MSWSIKSIGPRAAVRLAVLACVCMPAAIQASIVSVLDEPGNGNGAVSPAVPHDFARVEGYGHSGGGYGSIGKLEVELFTAAKVSDYQAEPVLSHKDRVRIELTELTERCRKLGEFIKENPAFHGLGGHERGLLVAQEQAMATYQSVLQARVSQWTPPPPSFAASSE